MNDNVEDIKKKYVEEITLDKTINVNGLDLHSVTVKDYYRFVMSVDVLNIDKNSINDPVVISMQYMAFLISLMLDDTNEDIQKYIYVQLYNILSISLQTDDLDLEIVTDKSRKPCFKINNITFSKNDFDLLRRIILIQNIPNYKEEHIDPFLKEDLRKAREIQSHGRKEVDIEHKITFISMITGMTFQEIYSMPIRKFMIMLEMEQKYTSYKILKQAETSGMVEFKREIPHYMDEINESIGIDYESFKNKINSAN